MISPKDILNKVETSEADNIIKLVDAALQKKSTHFKDRIEVIILGESSKETRDKVAELYMDPKVGWSNVTHITSSENGERAGLTKFTLYF